jgi:hypothetical protein
MTKSIMQQELDVNYGLDVQVFPCKERFTVLKNVTTGEYLTHYVVHPYVLLEFTPSIAECIQFVSDGTREVYMQHAMEVGIERGTPIVQETYTRVVSYVKDEV